MSRKSKTAWILIPVEIEYWEDTREVLFMNSFPTSKECAKCLAKAEFPTYDDAYSNIDYEDLYK